MRKEGKKKENPVQELRKIQKKQLENSDSKALNDLLSGMDSGFHDLKSKGFKERERAVIQVEKKSKLTK